MAEDGELNLALLCFIAYRAMETRVLADLAAAGFDDVTAAQGRVFARIDPDGTRVTDLAERALITKQTAGFLVDQLERAGYVRRVPDPRDARARLVQIAERGWAAVEIARQTEAAVEAEWTRHLGQASATQLRRSLTRLREIADPYQNLCAEAVDDQVEDPDGPGLAAACRVDPPQHAELQQDVLRVQPGLE